MIKKGSPGDGFILCLLLNLLFNFWWGAAAFILFILYLLLGVPLFLTFIGLFIWFFIAFLSTALVVWAVSVPQDTTPPRKNLNPYSAKNSDVFSRQNEAEDTEEPAQSEISNEENTDTNILEE